MKSVRVTVSAAIVAFAAAAALAQPGAGKGPGAGPGPKGAGQWGADVTPGWGLMTPQERNEHRDRMRAMKTYEECKTYQAQHHEQMAARAKERGGAALAQPRRDACSGLKP